MHRHAEMRAIAILFILHRRRRRYAWLVALILHSVPVDTFAMDKVQDLQNVLAARAPELAPQLRPRASAVSAELPAEKAVAACFATKRQRTEATDLLAARLQEAGRRLGGEAHMVLMCELDVEARVVLVQSVRFVGAVEASLYSVERFVQLQLDGASADEMQPCIDHFLATNGYDEEASSVVTVHEVFNTAFALKVLLDNIPDWKTRLGKHAVPVAAHTSAGAIVDELCPAPVGKKGGKKKSNGAVGGGEAGTKRGGSVREEESNGDGKRARKAKGKKVPR